GDRELLSFWRKVGRRDQHRELLAPDDHALEFPKIEARRDGVALAALEGAQAAEVDEHLAREIARGLDRALRHQIEVELAARPDPEVALKEGAVRARGVAALAPVSGTGGLGVNDLARRKDGAAPVRLAQLVGRGRGREHEREQKEAERHAEAGPQHAP